MAGRLDWRGGSGFRRFESCERAHAPRQPRRARLKDADPRFVHAVRSAALSSYSVAPAAACVSPSGALLGLFIADILAPAERLVRTLEPIIGVQLDP
ncbi:MAG TPA: hypothetical protein VJV79_40205 [Polyangiaceae bacterium]|nr:hypothetical protein [Polyangiaceae bacterium]